MNMIPSPLPVIVQNSFKVFAHPDGRYSAAVKVGNERLYARDYPAGALPDDDGLVEPDELNFIAALVRQGKGR